MVTAAMKLKDGAPWNKSYDQPRQHIKNTDITLPTKVRLVKAVFFPVRLGPSRKLSAEELMFLNCGIGEDLLGLQGDPTSPS